MTIKRVRLNVVVEVHDEQLLSQHNQEKAIEYHGDPHWSPEDLADAVASGLLLFSPLRLDRMGLKISTIEGYVIGDDDSPTERFPRTP